jgi:general secretion pathway protein G
MGIKKQTGFTIVELLIVIVVIGILAAITVIAFNSVKERATFSSYKSDLESIDRAINLYYADNAAYPGNLAGGGGCWTNSGTRNFISGLTPTYLTNLPLTPNAAAGNYYAYCFNSGGTEYKLIRLVNGGMTLPAVESANNPNIDPVRATRGWGIWSSGGSGL